ncbi:GIY-YIG nuclease family protein [Vibrio brasiliensis]|uniref:GIY-YIG nuclease family protein n=1 Tax=Vibrio brasiliensis TaxID=170652 RepID=UPI001EFEB97E|nr:GIY-YIG nuclease family protein [Vibrio brasiliensis]MCG9752195.1 GIY-YIG nuclease family protein [Vibrio brasiliensis]
MSSSLEKPLVKHSDWYVYLIRMRNNALYCGITTDVERRYQQHCNGTGAKALKGKGPLILEWHQRVGSSRSDASKVEYQIKQLSKAKKEQIISGKFVIEHHIDCTEIIR